MSTPKSVIKVNKNGVTYTSSVDKCQYYLFELTRAALRDVGKYVKKQFQTNFYNHFKKNTGDAGTVTRYKVWSNQNTTYPRVQIGLKTGKLPGFYGYFQEFGTSKTAKLGLFTKSAQDNIAEIIKIESQYLNALEDEASVLALIDESETEG